MNEIIAAWPLFLWTSLVVAGGWGLKRIVKSDKSIGILATNLSNMKVNHSNELSDLRYIVREQVKATENLAVSTAKLEATLTMLIKERQ